MHVGAVARFAGPAPGIEELRARVEGCLHHLPRYRQRLADPGLAFSRPVWVDDEHFDIAYHVHPAELSAADGADTAALRSLAERIFSQRLDRSRPLWEMWLVEGLADGRFALINKSHHAILDGMAGIGVTAAILDPSPEPSPPQDVPPWIPSPEPSRTRLAARELASLGGLPGRAGKLASKALAEPRRTAATVARAGAGLAETVRMAALTQPREPLNATIGPNRRISWTGCELRDVKEIKNGLGGTVNDVLVAAVAGGLGNWLRRRHVSTFGFRPLAMIPVSTRREDERDAMGNRLSAMAVPLPLEIRDPKVLLEAVRELMGELKRSPQTLAANAITTLEELAPAPLLERTSQIHFSDRLYSFLLTNVPGPQVPLFMLGREMEEFLPVGFLAPGKALAVTILSYNGRVNVGLLGDPDTVTDLDGLAEEIRRSIGELFEAARPPQRRGRPPVRGRRFQRSAEQEGEAEGEGLQESEPTGEPPGDRDDSPVA